MKFRIMRFSSWFFFIVPFAGVFLSNEILHLERYSWWILLIFTALWYVLFGVGVLCLWNVLRPCYLVLNDTGVVIDNERYYISEIEAIWVSKKRSVSIVLKKGQIIPITPWRTQRATIFNAVKQWAQTAGIPIH